MGHGILDRLLPPLCPVTGEQTGAPGTLAPEAWRDLGVLGHGPSCTSCGREIPGAAGPALLCDICVVMPRPWTQGAAAIRYEGAGRRIVRALKHGDRLDLAPLMAGWMLRAAPELVAEADLVAPVPLHWRRLVARRFNQSAELARALCRIAGRRGAYAPRLLRRVRATPIQGGLDRAEREANLAGAIRATPGTVRRLTGRRVLLVDDVMTTGATFAACARACVEAGAARVDVLACALVPFDALPYVEPDSERAETPDEDG